MVVTEEVKDFLQMNLFRESYRDIVHEYEYNGENKINFDIQPQYVIDKAERDLAIIKDRIEKFNSREGFKIGSKIKLPDGQYVMISQIWDESVQTSLGGSMHLGKSGYISFSGGMDSGIDKSDLILTDEVSYSTIWIFHNDLSGGGRGVYYKMPFQVYRTKRGADLSGIPQVRELAEEKIIKLSETITRINGNGQSYTLHMPKLVIVQPKSTWMSNSGVKKYPKEDCIISGLSFKVDGMGNLVCQPMKLKQINKLLKENDFKAVFHNNAANKNTLILTPTINQWDIIREFS